MTRRGGLLLGMAVLLIALGRFLGLADLYVLAAAAVLAVAAAAVYVRVVDFPLQARRRVDPPRVHLGAPCRVDLEVSNPTRRRVPSLDAEEPFGAAKGRDEPQPGPTGRTAVSARFVVPALGPGQTGRAAYRVPTAQRGRYRLGPLQLILSDPFGLARTRREVSGSSTVLVYPRIEAIPGMPPAPGHDPHPGLLARTARSQGEDFFALRPYEVGDDLRRVHWPSTARMDDLMIRQVELPWQQRTSVFLDVRRSVHDVASFERAVSAAASVLTGSQRSGAVTRLVTTDGTDSGFDGGRQHWDALMASLAGVEPAPGSGLAAALSARRHQATGSSVAVITTTSAAPADIDAVVRLREKVGLVVLILVERSSGPGSTGLPSRAVGALRILAVSESRPLAVAWAADPLLSRTRAPHPASRRRVGA